MNNKQKLNITVVKFSGLGAFESADKPISVKEYKERVKNLWGPYWHVATFKKGNERYICWQNVNGCISKLDKGTVREMINIEIPMKEPLSPNMK